MEQRAPIDPLRDIRPDLMARLRVASARYEKLMTEANEAKSDMDILQRLIERENARFQQVEASEPGVDLTEFLYNTLQDRSMNKEEMRHAAEVAGFRRIDGRSIHAVTVNLHRTGKIFEINTGVFTANKDLMNHARAGG
jgi:hypothetical protein